MKEIRFVLLGLIQQNDLYGYQIKKVIEEEQFKNWVQVPIASLYHELALMADEGLIERNASAVSLGRPARVIYRITSRGVQALRQALIQAWSQVGVSTSAQDLALLFTGALEPQELVKALTARLDGLQTELEHIVARIARYSQGEEQSPQLAGILEHSRLHQEAEIVWVHKLLADLRSQITSCGETGRSKGMGIGAFTFVLHNHLPYCRLAGRWPHGEEWIHQALAETYVPFLCALYDLRQEKVPFHLTCSMTPVLTEQLADQDIREHFLVYLDAQITAANLDIPRFENEGAAQLESLAIYYRDYYTWVRTAFVERFGGDVVAAYRTLQDEGYLEIITCAATHGYLPLLARDSSIYGQLRAGVESYRQHFGRAPRSIWLPECAYRPAYLDDEGVVRPAIEEFLSGLGITCFMVETHAIEGGHPVGKAADDVSIGPYGNIHRKYVLQETATPQAVGTTYLPYYVAGATGTTQPPVAVIGRNNRTGQQVWSADWGYPGDPAYREFHKKDSHSGMQYWRVTGPGAGLDAKDLYQPEVAEAHLIEHARHYAKLVEQLTSEYHQASGGYGIIASNYDAELFGHWWFEGVSWLREVLRSLSSSQVVDMTTANRFITQHEPTQMMAVPESSWGSGGTHWTWDNADTHWMWEVIHAAESRMERLVSRYPQADTDQQKALNQAARELLLLESSDWPFLVTTGQAKEYATKRFESHVERFNHLATMLEAGTIVDAVKLAVSLYEVDKVFPTIDYRWFCERQGKAR
ncbi:MAG: 1,4-alpha-glucan branching protein domain-containing protein [Anaerolineae bacterium]